MHFIIDKEIYFRPADGAIWNIDAENEKRYLTLASSRLLAFFIEHRGEIISREVIFHAVWERYGLHSSNNTLNQYISLLRRTLADFGLGAHVIKTIPKTGFLFSTELTITTVQQKHSVTNSEQPRTTRQRYKALLLCFLYFLLLLVLIGLWKSRSVSTPLSDSWQPSQEAEKCNIALSEVDDGSRLLASSNKVKYMTLVDDLPVEHEPARIKHASPCTA